VAAPDASSTLTTGFVVLPVVVSAAIVYGVAVAGRRLGEPGDTERRWVLGTAIAVVGWLAVTWALASSGWLARFDLRPPPFLLLPAVGFPLAVALTWSRFGTRLVNGLPMAALVGLQSFRFPLELLMHRAYIEGVMPVQMSYSGRNFDILAGLTAIPVAWALHRGIGGRRLALTWNIFGAVLLINIIAVAAAATPVIAAFGPGDLNTFVAYPPFVWLPAVLVLTAVTGHLMITRALYN
jgi:hypothetical protein